MGYTRCANGGYKRTPKGAAKNCGCCPGCNQSVISGVAVPADAPDSILAVISSITLCTGCVRAETGFGFQDAKIVSGTLADQSVCLLRDGTYSDAPGTPAGKCVFSGLLADPLVIETYASTTGVCTGAVLTTRTIDKLYVIFEGVSNYSASDVIIGAASEIFPGSPGNYILSPFVQAKAVWPNCVDGSFSNAAQLTDACGRLKTHNGNTGGVAGMRSMGRGGTVSLVMNGC